MQQGHTPFGYKIVDGKAVIDETDAEIIKKIYQNYLDGMSLENSAKEAGVDYLHNSVSRILLNKKYLGDDYYPPLIDKETYDKVIKEKERRTVALGRTNRIKPKDEIVIPYRFKIRKPTQNMLNPFEDAAYIYSLIESEI